MSDVTDLWRDIAGPEPVEQPCPCPWAQHWLMRGERLRGMRTFNGRRSVQLFLSRGGVYTPVATGDGVTLSRAFSLLEVDVVSGGWDAETDPQRHIMDETRGLDVEDRIDGWVLSGGQFFLYLQGDSLRLRIVRPALGGDREITVTVPRFEWHQLGTVGFLDEAFTVAQAALVEEQHLYPVP